jgi:hypothetical protein
MITVEYPRFAPRDSLLRMKFRSLVSSPPVDKGVMILLALHWNRQGPDCLWYTGSCKAQHLTVATNFALSTEALLSTEGWV